MKKGEVKEKKEKKKGKKGVIIAISVVIILLLIIGFLVYQLLKPKKITFDLGNGELVEVVVKDGEKVKLPDPIEKEGYEFSGWANKKNKFILETSELDYEEIYVPIYVDKSKKSYILTFKSDGKVIGTFKLEEGTTLTEPIRPTKDGYTFMGWLNEDGNFIQNNVIIEKDSTFTAFWVKNDQEHVTIDFDSDGGTKVSSITLEKGSKMIMPVKPEKDKKVFSKWVDKDGNEVTTDTVIDEDMTLTAIWIDAYTCPERCTPLDSGTKCERQLTTEVTKTTGCPSGTTLMNGLCVDTTKEHYANYVYNETTEGYVCGNGEHQYTRQFEFGVEPRCAPIVPKSSYESCPNGYARNGNICTKSEIIDCQKN